MTAYTFIFTYLLGCIQIFLLIQNCFSTLVVIPTNNTYQDRIAAFGSHLPDQGLVAPLIPIKTLFPNITDACKPLKPLDKGFIALVLRGNCTFIDKVRNLQSAGAIGVVVGNDEDDGLVTMFANGDSSDVYIPSVFISHTSYMNLIQLSEVLGTGLIIKLNPNDILQPLIDVLIITILSPAIMMTLIYILWRIRQRQIRKAQLAPVSVVQNLPVKTIHLDQMKPNDPEVCAICLEDYIDDDQVRIMPCKHEFHIECIDPWLTKRKKFCPICKKDTCPPTESTPLIPLNSSHA